LASLLQADPVLASKLDTHPSELARSVEVLLIKYRSRNWRL
jgi:hypothetical protein